PCVVQVADGLLSLHFFFQAEDGIRYATVTGVQTCALPISLSQWTFPRIPGVNIPHEVCLAYHLDFGSQWKSGIISNEPPKVGNTDRKSVVWGKSVEINGRGINKYKQYISMLVRL